MPRLVQEAQIAAPISDVYAIVADVERYPEFLPGVLAVKKQDDLVTMTVQAGPLELSWTHRATFTPESEITTRLVRGPFRRLDGRWTFEANEQGTLVTYTNVWDLDLPLPGAGFMVSRALTGNLERTMQAFKRRINAKTGASS